VAEHDARISGYTAGIGWFTHTLGESSSDLKALIGSATEYTGPGFLLPTRNAELFRWCLTHGLRVVQQMTLMTIGLYNEPQGAYLPGVLYCEAPRPTLGSSPTTLGPPPTCRWSSPRSSSWSSTSRPPRPSA
jgi:hypothetical protein